ncbi:MAG: DMT family transporter [Dysgonamonadaceae bacterium]|nr:DMT family transporter [Dysgonamonadaceae bacterium]
MSTLKTARYHIIALFVVVVWGTTLVATKTLLNNGMSPRDIFFIRFLLAYVCIWFFEQRRLWANNLKDEFLFMLLGVTGGSLYFMLSNTALEYTQASNAALLGCTAPILTIFLSRLLLKDEKLSRYVWLGSILAIVGVAFVVFNGQFALQVSPLGDVLVLLSALSWALYIILLKRLGNRYPTLFITRKVFFYGILTLLPLFLHTPLNINLGLLKTPVVLGSLLYLGIIASLCCFFLWNTAVKKLGAVRTGNYIYLSPLVTMVASVLIMNEVITITALVGTVLILASVALAERR